MESEMLVLIDMLQNPKVLFTNTSLFISKNLDKKFKAKYLVFYFNFFFSNPLFLIYFFEKINTTCKILHGEYISIWTNSHKYNADISENDTSLSWPRY